MSVANKEGVPIYDISLESRPTFVSFLVISCIDFSQVIL